MPGIFVGLMSGTSLDGVDAVLAHCGEAETRLIGHCHLPYAPKLRSELLALNQRQSDELRRAAIAAAGVARCCAAAVERLLGQYPPEEKVTAIGCHGQTVRHQPVDGYTLQLVNGALLAELTETDVVCDFRSRDIAAGGQGAPLVPAFHHAAFASSKVHRAVVNIGGIANVTDLPLSGTVTGFDCGPGNLLLDAWAQRHLNQPLDRDGTWASSGRVLPTLLAKLQEDEYFRTIPPKSAGRETFNLDWLVSRFSGSEQPADVQATLLALTARGIADAIGNFCATPGEVYLCGGGARNVALVALLKELLPCTVECTDFLGIAAEHVEALAFAWLAHRTMNGHTGNLPAVTGARGERVLGAIYRA